MLKAISTVLLVTLPVFFLTKTSAFAWFANTMRRQHPEGDLGRWLLWLFVCLSLTSTTLTVLFTVFAIRWHDADLTAWVLFMIPLEVFLAGASYCGWRVRKAYYEEVEHNGNGVTP